MKNELIVKARAFTDDDGAHWSESEIEIEDYSLEELGLLLIEWERIKKYLLDLSDVVPVVEAKK
jgi:hypothetical protein